MIAILTKIRVHIVLIIHRNCMMNWKKQIGECDEGVENIHQPVTSQFPVSRCPMGRE